MGISTFAYILIWLVFLFALIIRTNIPSRIKWIHFLIFIAMGLYWFPDIVQEFQKSILKNTKDIYYGIQQAVQISFLSLLVLFPIITIIIAKIKDEKTIQFITYFIAIFFVIIACLYIFLEMQSIVDIEIKPK